MRLDLHVHSHFSRDSRSSIEAILRRAEQVGLDGIAITDHNSVRSYFEAAERTRAIGLDLVIVPGAEISTSDGHLITLGTCELVPFGLSSADTIEQVHENGGTVVAPHPFAFLRQGIRDLQVKQLDAVEVFNSKYLFGFANYLAKRAARTLNLGVTGGSDSHKVETIGCGYTEINVPNGADVEQILSAIKDGRSQAKGRASPRLRSVGYSLKARIGDYKSGR